MDHSKESRPPLANLETVCLVARTGSLTAAAGHAGLTHGAVSRRVAAVENWLGTALFERHGRGVRLTPEGQRLVARFDQAFGIIDAAADQWRLRGGTGVVKLSAGASFARLWLLQRLRQIEEGEPRLRIELQIGYLNADVAAGEADMAVRYGTGQWPGVDAELLMSEQLFPVASPALAAKANRASGAGLLDFPLLHDSDLSGWRAWASEHGVALRPRSQDRRFEDYSTVLAAAEAGLGLALARSPLANDFLARGTLVRVKRAQVPNPLSFYLVTARKEQRPAVLAAISRIKALL
ncbi:LysR substrate-binding domain-containing protein [Massilia endophytica]|uniref:LysR substrate-binding domain-containing protein n=1 Tax=Massilia endophytica TaxID=2899220 RepID=UPI001E502040|nr:LysR substrate-binding domain-containing protein [Massilia endophytica]UGQ46716.1 LysR substrate-binding domain-containing protein [Massilia endophytica]